jgi:hypothetical protein
MASVDRSLVVHLPLFAGPLLPNWTSFSRKRAVRHPKNSNVFEQGQEATPFSFCCTAMSAAEKPRPTASRSSCYVSAGEVFGVAQAIGLKHYPHRGRSRRQRVATVPSAAWPRCGAAPALAANALQTVRQRLQEAHTRVIEMTTESGRRIAHALLRLKQQAARLKGIEIDFPISRDLPR